MTGANDWVMFVRDDRGRYLFNESSYMSTLITEILFSLSQPAHEKQKKTTRRKSEEKTYLQPTQLSCCVIRLQKRN